MTMVFAGLFALALAAAVWFVARLALLKRSLRQVNDELGEIVEHLEDSRIVKLPQPSAELEALLGTVNRALEGIRRQAVTYARREAQLKTQIESMSHDLRTPLTAIRGNAEMLEDPDLPPELHEKFCSIIINESERLSRLTHDLLTLQRIADDTMPMELSRVNLRELATGVLDALEPILRDRHANTEIIGEAPDVLGDPDRLKQAVTNLVENASRFIEPDGHITIELFGLKGNSILAVKDDGTGFGDIDPQLLFDRFYRTDASRSRGTGGTGLGLAIVKSVVEAHDGTVEAINLPDGGACFIIALPSIPADISRKPERKPER